MARTELNHDAFARTSLVRRTTQDRQNTAYYGLRGGCDNCGQYNGYGSLFQYGTERDDRPGRIDWHRGLFCSKGCHDSYHS